MNQGLLNVSTKKYLYDSSLPLNTVIVLGVQKAPNQVDVDGKSNQFEYDSVNHKLIINNIAKYLQNVSNVKWN